MALKSPEKFSFSLCISSEWLSVCDDEGGSFFFPCSCNKWVLLTGNMQYLVQQRTPFKVWFSIGGFSFQISCLEDVEFAASGIFGYLPWNSVNSMINQGMKLNSPIICLFGKDSPHLIMHIKVDIIFKFESRKTWAFKMTKGAQSL